MDRQRRLSLRLNSQESFLEAPEVDAEWPKTGVIEAKDLKVAYRNDLGPVLKGVSFKIETGFF